MKRYELTYIVLHASFLLFINFSRKNYFSKKEIRDFLEFHVRKQNEET